jgi:hypothetical protein|tara:strand:- start:779 stop:1117 length:339 start_codon:yes stop_codon:yes gene_type:complete
MAAHYDLNITQGNSFHIRLAVVSPTGTPFDLTNWNLRGFAKLKYSESNILIDLQPTKASPQTQGLVDISIPASFTKTLPITEGVFDIEMYDDSGFVDKPIKGYVRIYPEVTS